MNPELLFLGAMLGILVLLVVLYVAQLSRDARIGEALIDAEGSRALALQVVAERRARRDHLRFARQNAKARAQLRLVSR